MRKLLLYSALVATAVACGDTNDTHVSDDPGSDTDATDAGDVIDAAADGDAGDVVDATDTGPMDTFSPDTGSDIADVADGSGADAADTEVDTGPPSPLQCDDIVPGEWDDGTPLTFDPSSVPQDEGAFDIGVQSGAARAESILLWTHIADDDDKTLYVWRESETDGEVIVAHSALVEPGSAGYTHVPVADLAPCTWYSYAFFTGTPAPGFTGRSQIGRFRTAFPDGSLDPVRVGATSCTNDGSKPWEALSLTAEQDIDLVFHLGDRSYNDSADTLAEYRARWRSTLNDPGYRALHGAASHLSTWDDHEVTNDWNPETIGFARLEHATNAYFETLAVERGPENRLWESYRWGDTMEVWVTDNRSERRPSTRLTRDAQYVSPEQMDWLKAGLLASDAHFKVVFSSVPITNMPIAWDVAAADRWEGYPAQRDELLEFITDNAIDNVWFIGGDFHVGFVGRVEPSGPLSGVWEIAVGPGGNGPNVASLLLPAAQFPFHTDLSGSEFMTTMEFDPIADAVRVVFANSGGDVVYDEWVGWGD